MMKAGSVNRVDLAGMMYEFLADCRRGFWNCDMLLAIKEAIDLELQEEVLQ